MPATPAGFGSTNAPIALTTKRAVTSPPPLIASRQRWFSASQVRAVTSLPKRIVAREPVLGRVASM